MTTLTLLLALFPRIRIWLAGAFELGVALSFAFFAAIAAGADLAAMISVAPMLIAVVLILLTLHLALLLVLGAAGRLTLPNFNRLQRRHTGCHHGASVAAAKRLEGPGHARGAGRSDGLCTGDLHRFRII